MRPNPPSSRTLGVMSGDSKVNPTTRFLLARVAPILLLWLALYASTFVAVTARDASVVWPFQVHLAVAILVPVLNAWVFFPRFRDKTAAFLSGLVVPAIAFVALLAA